MRLVILESPYAGEVQRNIDYARRCIRDSLSRGEAPIASHLLYTQPGILNDDDPLERDWGIAASAENRLMKVASELDRLVKLYSTGVVELEQVADRMKELQDSKKTLTDEAATARAHVPIIEIHPAAINRFYDSLKIIRGKIIAGEDINDAGLIAAIRGAISHIVVRDRPSGGYEAEVVTFVAALTGETIPNLGGSMVAEERLELPTRGL